MGVINIIQNLESKYCQLKKSNPDIVINGDWQKINKSKPIKLIIVGDNPGKLEEKSSVYFHSNGQSGKRARHFAQVFLDTLSDNELHGVIFMNKCPFHSISTQSLIVNKATENAITESISSTIKALEELSKFKELTILITGCAYNKLNRRFFKQLLEVENWDEKFVFGKHFSYNHFNNQLNSSDKKSIKEKLKVVNKETIKIIENRFVKHKKTIE